MLDILSTLDDLRQTGAQFLMTDLSAALTFTEIARTSEVPETRARNAQNAAKAYRTIERLTPKVHLLPEDAEKVSELCVQL